MKVVKELGKRIELAKKTWMPKTILPIEIINFFLYEKHCHVGKEKKERKKLFAEIGFEHWRS